MSKSSAMEEIKMVSVSVLMVGDGDPNIFLQDRECRGLLPNNNWNYHEIVFLVQPGPYTYSLKKSEKYFN